MAKPSYPKTEVIFKRLFLPERRICSSPQCKRVFFCTGMCPKGRWIVPSNRKENKTACYCEKCMKESTLKSRENRLKVCYR